MLRITIASLLLLVGVSAQFINIEFGERETGDQPIFISTNITEETLEPTTHRVTFFWDGTNTNEIFTGVTFETSSVNFFCNL